MPPLLRIPRQDTPSYQQNYARVASGSANTGLSKGLIGAWAPPLGNTGAVLRDATGFRADGVLDSDMDPATDWIQTTLGYMLAYDGSNDEVQIPHREALNMPGDGTVIMVFRKNGWVTNDGFCGKHGSGNRNWHVFTGTTTDSVRFVRIVGATSVRGATLTDAAYYDGTPTFVAAVSIGRNIHLYVGKVGGQLDFADGGHNDTWATNSNPGPIVIGNYRNDGNNKRIVADIGTMLFYNRALPEAEVRMLFTDHLAPFRQRSRIVGFGPEAIAADPVGNIIQPNLAVQQASTI